jgi:hypothetical protein
MRSAELAAALAGGTATVVEHLGRISGYATKIGYFAHAVAETNEDMKALIAAAPGPRRARGGDRHAAAAGSAGS